MSVLARALRLDQEGWRWLTDDAGPVGAALIVLGTYLLLAFSRFGWPDFAIRPTTRFLLVGLYGWMWLAVASWLVARAVSGPAPLSASVRLTGHAHVPLLLLAAFVQLVAVSLDFTNVARWPALFVGAFWMPAQLGHAVAASSGLRLRRAVVVAAGPYVVWAAVVGRHLWSQLAHLL
ncbi:MAG: hypothetical protein HKN80_04805 [Acidimicrobiia bacterium]|nr:hypothetical protein [Acidimicrobiia bacterium]